MKVFQHIFKHAEEGNTTHLPIYNVKHHQRNYNERKSKLPKNLRIHQKKNVKVKNCYKNNKIGKEDL